MSQQSAYAYLDDVGEVAHAPIATKERGSLARVYTLCECSTSGGTKTQRLVYLHLV